MPFSQQQKEELHHVMEGLSEDLQMEVLVNELLENNLLDEQLMWILPRGIFHRGYRRDRGRFEFEENDLQEIIRILLPVYREGLFDALPSGVFHYPKTRTYQKSADQISRELDLQKEEETAARDFFLPIEQEFYRQRIHLERKERSVIKGFSSEEGQYIFLRDFWQIDIPRLPAHQTTLLLDALTLSFSCKGFLDKAAALFSLVLHKEVKMDWQWGAEEAVGPGLAPALGENYLGQDTVLEGDFLAGTPGIRIHIPSIPIEEIAEFLPGETQDRLLRTLVAFFISADLRVTYQLDISLEDRYFILDDKPEQGIMGFSTYL